MAKITSKPTEKSIDIEAQTEEQLINMEAQETNMEELDDAPVEANKEQEGSPEAKETSKAKKALPEHVVKIFECFSNYKELWIDEMGGVFVEKPKNSTKAILYKKPNADPA